MSLKLARILCGKLASCASFVCNCKSNKTNKSSTMKTLALPFAILTYVGMWAPMAPLYHWQKRLYNVLRSFVLITIYTFVASELLEVSVYLFKCKGISETLYLFLPTSAACFKALVFLQRRARIISFGSMLQNDHCIARDAKEKEIQKKFDDVNRYVTGIGMCLVYSYVILMMTTPFTATSNKQHLPYKTWIPYDMQSPCNYWFSYAHQMLALYCCGSINAAIDNIVTGYMLQACAQFTILEHRFNALPRLIRNLRSEMSCKQANQYEKTMLIRYIQHHDYIYSYARNLMSTFNSIILVQFCASSLVITISVYRLSTTDATNVDFVRAFLYLIIMLVEFMMYCWFGNEINAKSLEFAENVYRCDWMALNLKSRKMMLLLIQRSYSKPIVISCYNMVFLSLNTYVQILKFSYSAFNVLRKSNVHEF